MKKIQHSVHSRFLGVSRDGHVVATGLVAGDTGKQIEYPSPTRVAVFHDFLGDALPGELNAAVGSATPTFAISAAVNGVGLITTAATAGTMAADGVCVNYGVLNYKASQNLVFETRLKLDAIASVSLFVGFTDTVALEAPISLSGTTFTSNATDAVGILYDSSATTDTFRLCGVANDVDVSHQDSGEAPTAATYVTLRVEVNSSGVAAFYIDGVRVGTSLIAAAVTTTVALTPVIAIFPRSAAAVACSVDYIHVASDRVA